MSLFARKMFNTKQRKEQEEQQQKQKKVEKDNKKKTKSFIHGINVIFRIGEYKGHHGIVNNFYPATYDLILADTAYVEADGPMKRIGDEFKSEFGDSEVIRIIPGTNDKNVKIIIYRDNVTNQPKVGLVINIVQNVIYNTVDLSSIIETNETNNLTEQLSNMYISEQNRIRVLLDNFIEQLRSNTSLLTNIMYPMQNNNMNTISVHKTNILSPIYYVNISTHLGNYTEYDPSKTQYLIKYNKDVRIKPSMINIDQNDKRYAYIKKGNKRCKIKKYNNARVDIVLTSTGKKIYNHAITKMDKNGVPLKDTYGNPTYIASPIYPIHLFYMDLHLKNGKDAQVIRMINNEHLTVIEKDSSNYNQRNIKLDDIEYMHPGFKFIFIEDNIDDTNYQFVPYNQEQVSNDTSEETSEETYEETDHDDSQEIDYGEELHSNESELDNSSDTQQEETNFKQSIKDNERTAINIELTSQQKNIKSDIEKVLRLLKNKYSINMYSTIIGVENIINIFNDRLRVINFNKNIFSISDYKYIIVLIIIYMSLKNNNYLTLHIDNIINLLYKTYIYMNDISNVQRSIFFTKWDNKLSDTELLDSNNYIKEQLNMLKTPKLSEQMKDTINKQIIKAIFVNADKIIQRINNTDFNISHENTFNEPKAIVSTKRYREEDVKMPTPEIINKYITIKDLLQNNIPTDEIPIKWGELVNGIPKYLNELTALKNQLSEKYEKTKQSGYLYIKNNLHRAPFAIRDNIHPSVTNVFKQIYETMLLPKLQKIFTKSIESNVTDTIDTTENKESKKKFEKLGKYYPNIYKKLKS